MISIGELAKMAGVSARTLRYYDQAGLLAPSAVTQAGYRLYGDEAIRALAEILFFRELDFSIDEILRARSHPDYDAHEALEKQRALLTLRRDRLNRLIDLAGRALKGEVPMELNAFDMTRIQEAEAKYADEARERWGGTDAYEQSAARAASYGKADWARVSAQMQAVFDGFAKLVGTAPDSPEAKALVLKWQDVITQNFYECTDEILLGLGSLYEADERFAKNIDTAGEGTARFMTAAIRACLG